MLSVVPDPDLEIRGGAPLSRLLDKKEKGVGRTPEELFSALRASVWSKYKEAGPRAPTLDPPVLMFVAHLQIDSQVPDATFQTVLYPVPPPKSLAAENGKGRL